MKKLITLYSLLLLPLLSASQDAKEIFQKSADKCQSIESGYYEMRSMFKPMTDKDTFSRLVKTHFKKLPKDTLFPVAFHSRTFSAKGEAWGFELYTGKELIDYRLKDSSATRTSVLEWSDYLKQIENSFSFYKPLTHGSEQFFGEDSSLYSYRYLGEAVINNTSCHHIRISKIPINDSLDPFQAFRIEMEYWVNKEDMVPLKYADVMELMYNGDSMCQYRACVLDKYELDVSYVAKELEMTSLPSYLRMKEYVPYERPNLLPLDTLAPLWKLPSLDEEEISLDSLKGKIILIDFFYKGCFPCLLALPGLQQLHEKYQGEGFKVIGIDPYDTKEDGIAEFLKKHGVTYPVLLGDKKVVSDYRVAAYPSMYLIGRDGKIVFTNIGYGDGVDEKLEEAIEKELKRKIEN